MNNDITDIGARIKTVGFVAPQAFAAGETLSGEIDSIGQGWASAQLTVFLGATTGTPTSGGVIVSLQHSATSGGSYATYTPIETGVASTITLATDATTASHALNINMLGAERFWKIGVNPTLAGGSTPKTLVAAYLVAGDSSGIPSVA